MPSKHATAFTTLRSVFDDDESETQQQSDQYITFWLKGTAFGVPLSDVQGVERDIAVTAIPHAAPWLLGISNLRGEIASVVDLAAFLGADTGADEHGTRWKERAHRSRIDTERGLVVRVDDSTYIFLVDEARQIIAVPVDAIRSLASGLESNVADFLRGLYITENETIYVLSLPAVIASSVMQEGAAVNIE